MGAFPAYTVLSSSPGTTASSPFRSMFFGGLSQQGRSLSLDSRQKIFLLSLDLRITRLHQLPTGPYSLFTLYLFACRFIYTVKKRTKTKKTPNNPIGPRWSHLCQAKSPPGAFVANLIAVLTSSQKCSLSQNFWSAPICNLSLGFSPFPSPPQEEKVIYLPNPLL